MMRAWFAVFMLSVRQMVRSRAFIAGALGYHAGVGLLALAVSTRGPKEETLKFYVAAAWLLVMAYGLALVLALPVSWFAHERRTRRIQLLAVRPLSRAGYLCARTAACAAAGGGALVLGVMAVWGGAQIVAARAGVPAALLSGCAVVPAPPRDVPALAVSELAQTLSRDAAFHARWGDEGVRRMARSALSVWRLAEGEEARIQWEGVATAVQGTRLRCRPRVYPPFDEVLLHVTLGDGPERAWAVRTGLPVAIPVEAGAFDPDGRLRVRLRTDSDRPHLVVFPEPDGLALYVPQVGLAGNLWRAGLLSMAFLASMAALGVLAGAALSPNVGLLAVGVLLIVALAAGALDDALAGFTVSAHHHEGHEEASHGVLSDAVRHLWQKIMQGVIAVVPRTAGVDPGTELAEGRLIGMRLVARAALEGLALRGGIALGLAWWIFRRQELGARR